MYAIRSYYGGDDQPWTQGFFTVGHTANLSTTAAIEIAFDREKVPGLDNDMIKIAVS